jgi:DNA polymerase-1
MRNSKNVHVGGLFSFIKTIYKCVDLYKIDSIIIFDDSKLLFKKGLDSKYKTHRESTPEELLLQKKILIDYFEMVKIPVLCVENYEADDLIDNYVNLVSTFEDHSSYIISSDKDLYSLLLLNSVFIIDSNKNIVLDKVWLQKEYGQYVTKEKILLYYSLCGDSSDNIAGIKGIGDKTARVIMEQYSSLDELYLSNLDDLKVSLRIKNLLEKGKESAYLSLKLFTPMKMDNHIFTKYININWNKDNFLFGNKLLSEYECYSLIYKSLAVDNTPMIDEEKEKLPYAKDLFITKIVFTEQDFLILKSEIESAPVVALDTETFSGDPRTTRMIGFSLCTAKESAWYIPLIINGEKVGLYDLFITIISYIDANKKCVMHNALFDMHVISTLNIEIPKNIFDTMLAAYIFKEIKIGLKELSLKILNEKMNSFSQIMEFGLYKTFDEVEITKAAKYAATDARQTYLLYNHFNELLQKNEYANFDRLFKEIEMPLLNVLCDMEATGILCDKSVLIQEEIKYLNLVNDLHEKIKSIALEKEFILNPMSNKQTAHFLYHILQLPSMGKSERTDQTSLSFIEHLHEVIPLILLYRSLKSNISHFTTGLLKYIENDNRIHTHYQQFITQTGRITTINPNLQNIPRTNDIYKIRSAFYAKDNFLLFSFDYSQIELRVLAFFSQDPLLIKLFNENEDIHELTACMIFNKDKKCISPSERQIAKKINFSIVYGQGAYALSKELKIPISDAKRYLDIFRQNYSGIFEWIDLVVKKASFEGFILTLHGLKRFVPELSDNNKHIFKSGVRIAVNSIIQGTAAEIMKKAMIAVHNYLKEHNCGNIVLQIHDELLIELEAHSADFHSMIIKKKMETIINDQIKLQVNVSFGKTWS